MADALDDYLAATPLSTVLPRPALEALAAAPQVSLDPNTAVLAELCVRLEPFDSRVSKYAHRKM